MLTIVWEFRVKPEAIDDFESQYGPSGNWVAFFRKAKAYRGTVLVRDVADPTRYLTIDTWDDEPAYRRFHQDFAGEYAALDKLGEALTSHEHLIGFFS